MTTLISLDKAEVTGSSPVSPTCKMRSAAAFLQWLAERDRPLDACAQADVDAWLAGASALRSQ